MKTTRHSIAALVLLASIRLATAQTITPDIEAARNNFPMPSGERVRAELEKLRPTADKALNAPLAKPLSMPEPAKPIRLPDSPKAGLDILAPQYLRAQAANAPPLDPAIIARALDAKSPKSMKMDNTLLVFVSFSIPDTKLRRLLEMAADAKATVVFRGPADGTDLSSTRFVKKLKGIKPERLGDVEINPPLFTRFRIQEVPAIVLARLPESLNEQDGCSPPGSFASVTGGVSIEYALRLFDKQAEQDIAKIARRYLDRMASVTHIGSLAQ